MNAPRLVEVAPERLDGWVERFSTAHGEVSRSCDRGTSPSSWELAAADGSWARLTGWQEAEDPSWPRPPVLLVVLVRRGGYAVALVSEAGELVAHKVGTRHVQSRTAAGGWSQQRYARRRGNQADALVEAVAGHGARVLEEGETRLGRRAAGLVLGGDRSLAGQTLDMLAAGNLRRVLEVPRRELWDLPDPRRAVLDDAVRSGRAVRVEVRNA
ncbi:acVLRF1 family peptidyl-tRNA hydrolase [Serinicoccus sp. LYQ131]|uniref:acVLRF1 family peptidyl-tRNA hydrolase n=1 Tax=Serinicoccus sp. LYQ131 TaxID=3378797 RepID=UPI003853E895